MSGMQKKTINKIITKKFDAWVASIDDISVQALVNNNTIITGGCIASMLLGENVNDYDVYFCNFETTKAVAEYYATKMGDDIEVIVSEDNRVSCFKKSRGVSGNSVEFDDDGEMKINKSDLPDFTPVFISSNAITLSSDIQIVLRFYGNPKEIHDNYDFCHCMNYWHSKDGIVLNQDSLECILSKTLVYKGSKYPLASIIRSRKFIKRGWHISAGEYLKMCLQLHEIDLMDIATLSDQLTGVDVTYFNNVISAIKESNQEKITASYLCEIINRIY